MINCGHSYNAYSSVYLRVSAQLIFAVWMNNNEVGHRQLHTNLYCFFSLFHFFFKCSFKSRCDVQILSKKKKNIIKSDYRFKLHNTRIVFKRTIYSRDTYLLRKIHRVSCIQLLNKKTTPKNKFLTF